MQHQATRERTTAAPRAWWRLLAAGTAAVIAGVIWGSLFAGVPNPDATAEQADRYEWHVAIATWLMLGGVLSVAVSIVGLVRLRRKRRASTASASRR